MAAEHLGAALTVGIAMLLAAQSSSVTARESKETAELEEHVAVVCLLPGRLRKLGGQLTYVERRKPIETTAPDCEIRGGEYTAYDRANYANALSIWREAADQGDAKAMTYVGEIYERKLGEPDYARAAEWYQRAVAAGDRRAMRHLANLYESGLGVPRDTAAALSLWRRAAGIDEELVLASQLDAITTAADQRVAELARALEAQNETTRRLRDGLSKIEARLAQQQVQLASAQRELETERTRDEGAVDARTTLADRETEIALLNTQVASQAAQLDASRQAADIQRRRLEETLAALDVERRQRSELDQNVVDLERRLASLGKALESSKQQVLSEQAVARALQSDLVRTQALTVKSGTERAKLEAKLVELQAEIERRRDALSEREQRLATLEEEWLDARAARERAERESAGSAAGRAELEALLTALQAQLLEARAQIAGLDARLAEETRTRSNLESQIESLERQARQADGAESAMNRTMAKLDETRRSLALKDKEIADLQFALWKQGIEMEALTESRERQLESITRSFAPPAVPDAIPPDVVLGKYHALLIANSDYRNIEDLASPGRDAQSIAKVLEEQYGFSTDVRENLDRVQMYAALKDLQRFGEDDLVLIYYGGHGAVDERGDGHWLPVDFDPSAPISAVAIPSEQITKHLNMMSARHVMVVADSCYSGAMLRNSMPAVVRDVHKRLRFFVQNPSRTILTSGGDEPVLDVGSDQHSVFARAFIDTLTANQDLIYGEAIYAKLRTAVQTSSARLSVPQTPRFAGLADAGHGNGQFVFRRLRRSS